jgi:RNA polymerase sigma factor (TIGR02999 family)
MSDVTRILTAIEQGDPHAAEKLLPLVYRELRKLASQKLAREQPGQTLEPTALVHEAYLRLVAGERRGVSPACADEAPHWNSRGHFFAAAAEAMRRILIENARRKQAEKHGGHHQRVELAEAEIAAPSQPEAWLLLDDALACLAGEDPAAAELAKLRIFAGLSAEEAGEVLGTSRATAFRHWTYARAWLQARLRGADG